MRYDYAYDSMGRLLSKSASGRTLLSYTYDLNGNRTSMTDVTGKCTGYRYNSLDLLEEIEDNKKIQARYYYNGDGTICRLEVGNSLITEYGYDVDKNLISQKTVMMGMEEAGNPLGKLTGLQPQIGNNPKSMVLVDNAYAYDNNANRIEKRTLAGLNRFTYDSVNRLVKAEYPMGAQEYRYDKAGNRTAKVWKGADAASGVEEKYHYDSCNRLTRHDILPADLSKTQEIRCYSYDAQGNMLSDGNRQFVYDAMNRLSEVKNADGTHQKNHYDGEGLRAELEENGRLVSFIFDGDKVVNEKDTENTIRYIRGYELISSDSEKARTYYHYACDEMGSITHVTDEEGSVLNRYEYDAFGDCTYKEQTVANRFGFAGEQFDPVAGMYYLRARFYNPVIGRFIQEDTYYGDGLNLYAYCHNNPVGYVDPSGHAAEMCDDKQCAIDALHQQHPDWDDAAVEAEYRRICYSYGCSTPAQARRITGENNILNKPISQWTAAELQRAIDSIHNAQFHGKWYGNLSPMAVMVDSTGRVVITKNGGPIRLNSAAGQMAIRIFGDDVEMPVGRGSNYPRIGDILDHRHAEARAIQAFIHGDTSIRFNDGEARLACSHYSCGWVDRNTGVGSGCTFKLYIHNVLNVTGSAQDHRDRIGRTYVSDLWELD